MIAFCYLIGSAQIQALVQKLYDTLMRIKVVNSSISGKCAHKEEVQVHMSVGGLSNN